jgi:radical SAM superfamily enzyme YgiQ (UPF0313 family)
MAIKILFISAYDHNQRMKLCKYPPLGLGYIVSFLRKNMDRSSIECKIVDDDIEKYLGLFKPDIVGISTISQNFDIAKNYAQIAKRKGCKIIMGGMHISSLPHTLPSEADVGVMGEGEETTLELIRLFSECSDFPRNKLANMRGIVFYDENRLVQTEPRCLMDNLDDLPLPARDLMDIKPSTYVFSSRGCPYKCVFCASTRFFNRVRFFSPEYVVSEIEELVRKYSVKEIFFMDDLFIADKKRFFKIKELIKSKGLDKKVEFGASVRTNLITEEIVSVLKDMGVKFVTCGLESGNPGSLKYLKGESVSVGHNLRAIELCNNAGLRVVGSFVIGHPKETKRDMMDTYDFIKKNKLHYADVYMLTPFPGTPIWDYAKKRGLVSDHMDWSSLRMDFRENFKKAIILSECLSREQLRRIHRKFYRLLETRRFALRIKEKVRQIFGMKGRQNGAG